MRTLRFIVFLLLAAVAVAQQPAPARQGNAEKTTAAKSGEADAPASPLPSEATVESFMRHMFGYDPSISWKVLKIEPAKDPSLADVTVGLKNAEGQQITRFFVTPDGKYAVVGDLVPFGADPFAPVRQQLEAKAHGPARGPADSKITIVEFSDLQCPSCKAAQPTIDRLLTDVPEARFVFQNFPLEQLHPWAFKAATYADCIGRDNNENFWKFVHAVYDNQEKVLPQNADEKLKQFAAEAGEDANRIAGCAADPETAARVRESQELGKAVGVTGTPTLFINGRAINSVGTIPYDLLKALAQSTPNQ
jgi:protein-disulfide isomerase